MSFDPISVVLLIELFVVLGVWDCKIMFIVFSSKLSSLYQEFLISDHWMSRARTKCVVYVRTRSLNLFLNHELQYGMRKGSPILLIIKMSYRKFYP